MRRNIIGGSEIPPGSESAGYLLIYDGAVAAAVTLSPTAPRVNAALTHTKHLVIAESRRWAAEAKFSSIDIPAALARSG